jgi:membrane protein required for colicin V production
MSVAALILGLLSAIFFFRKAGEIVRDRFLPYPNALPEIVSFVALFLVVFVTIKIVEALLKEIITGVHLTGPDRFLGFLLGLAEGLIVVCLLLFIINIQPFVHPGVLVRDSFFAEILLPFIIGNRREQLESVVLIIKMSGEILAGV